jgi:ABC-type transport system involved in multi-copper enzyme maturation permease subunit
MLFVLILFLSLWLAFHHFQGKIVNGRNLEVQRQELARFAQTFFFAFLAVQFATVVLVTPVWLGGAIAEEKDRRRLEFLLTTQLRHCEIVLGKLLAGLGSLGLLLLGGVPVLAMMQIWGGIEPSWLLTSYAVTGVTLLSLGGLTLFCSVHARKPRDAILMTYLVLMVFAVVSVLCSNLKRESMLGWRWLAWLADGNILIVLHHVYDDSKREWVRDSNLSQVVSKLPPVLLHYAVFHGTLALVSVTGATLWLRRAAWPRHRPSGTGWFRRLRLPRPALKGCPSLWKELFLEPAFRLGGFGWTCVAVILAVSLAAVYWRYLHYWHSGYDLSSPDLQADLREKLDVWGRLVVTAGASLTLLGVAIRAAGSISGERDRHTLDCLLTTPLPRHRLLFAKWVGSILSVRRIGVILLVIWLASTGISGLRSIALLACAAAWVAYAAGFAMVGLWFSASCGSTRRAMLWTLGTLLLLGLGHWTPQFFEPRPTELRWPRTIAQFGLTPAAGLHWIALQGDDLNGEMHLSSRVFDRFLTGEYSLRALMTRSSDVPRYKRERREVMAGTIAGLLFWLGLAAALWPLTLRRFRAYTRRTR